MGMMLSIPSTVLSPFQPFTLWNMDQVWKLVHRYEKLTNKSFGTAYACSKPTLAKMLKEEDHTIEAIWEELVRQEAKEKKMSVKHALATTENINALAFISGLFIIAKGTIKRKVSHAYKIFDFNKNGDLSLQELIIMFQACAKGLCTLTGHPVTVSLKRDMDILARRWFRDADENKDRRLTLREIIRMLARCPEIRLVLQIFSDEKLLIRKSRRRAERKTATSPYMRKESILSTPNLLKFPSIKRGSTRRTTSSKRYSTAAYTHSEPRLPSSAPGLQDNTVNSAGPSSPMWASPGSPLSPSSPSEGGKAWRRMSTLMSTTILPAMKEKQQKEQRNNDNNIRTMDDKWDDTTTPEPKDKKEKEEMRRRQWLANLIAKKLEREDKIAQRPCKITQKTAPPKKKLSREERLRKCVSVKAFGPRSLARAEEGCVPIPDEDHLHSLRLWRIYAETEQHVMDEGKGQNVSYRPIYTVPVIIKLCQKEQAKSTPTLMRTFRDFLRFLYPDKNAMTDPMLTRVEELAKLTNMNSKFVKALYDEFLACDHDFEAEVDLHTYLSYLGTKPRFRAYYNTVRLFLKSQEKKKVQFPEAAAHLFAFSKTSQDVLRLQFQKGFTMAAPLNRTLLEGYQNAFKKYDHDGGGTISHDEMEEHLMSIQSLKMSQKELRALFKEMDTNGDGEVDWKEFVNFHRQFIDSADRVTCAIRDFDKICYDLHQRVKTWEQAQRIKTKMKRELASREGKQQKGAGAGAARVGSILGNEFAVLPEVVAAS
uniref:EF-hand domain-containing protein n=1 Tax=Lotharella globosa TaxID=91324 RepID=A0A7S3ZBZ9_9EUKA